MRDIHPRNKAKPAALGGVVAQWVERWTCDQQVVKSHSVQSYVLRSTAGFHDLLLTVQFSRKVML